MKSPYSAANQKDILNVKCLCCECLCNTPIPEKTGSCMPARLNSPRAFKMANEMLGKNEEIRMYEGQSNLSGANVIRKRKRVGHKCCGAANSNNRSKNRPDLLFSRLSFLRAIQVRRRKPQEILMKRGDTYFSSVGNNFCCSARFLPTDFKLSRLTETMSRTLSVNAHQLQSTQELISFHASEVN